MPKRTLYLTFGVATATLLVVVAVLAGPTLVACYGSPAGLGSCLRERVAAAGLLPPSEAPVETAAPDVPPTAPAAPEAPAETAAAAPLELPQFNLLRAAPDGSLVIAGSGAPGAEIEVFADGELFGTTTAEPSGDWVVVPDRSLPPGEAEITVGVAGDPRRSEQAYVVVIDEARRDEPLVVATAPGEASSVLQGLPPRPDPQPAAPQPDPAPDAAASPEPAPQATVAEPRLRAPPTPAAEPVPEQRVATAPTPPGAPSSAPRLVAPPGPKPVPQAVPAPVPPPDSAPAELPKMPAPEATAPAEEGAPEDTAPTPPPPSLRVPVAPPALQPDSELEVEPEPPPRDTALLAPPQLPKQLPAEVAPPMIVQPSIDAIEIDGEANFFAGAGAGAEGLTVRLYVDGRHVADTEVQEGRWLVEAEGVLDKRQQRVRIDVLAPASARVLARAEVNFIIDLPEDAFPAVPEESAAVPDPEPEPAVEDAAPPRLTAAPVADVPPAPNLTPAPAPDAAPAPDPSPAPAAGPKPPVRTAEEPRPPAVAPTEPARAAAPEPADEPEQLPLSVANAPEPRLAPDVGRERIRPAEALTSPRPPAPAPAAAPPAAAIRQGVAPEPATATTTTASKPEPELRPRSLAAVADPAPEGRPPVPERTPDPSVAGGSEPTMAAPGPEPVATPVPEPEPISAAEPEVTPEPEPATELGPEAGPKTTAEPEPAPLVEPESEPQLKLESEPRSPAASAALPAGPPAPTEPPAEPAEFTPPAGGLPSAFAADMPSEPSLAAIPAETEAVVGPAASGESQPPPPVAVPPLQVPEPIRRTAVADSSGEAPATPEAEDEEEIPTLIARRVGGPDAQRFASGTAIIRRGDNLWTIARRVYGDGLKYTTIYRANRDQIRNPARIYPGQVFDLPLVYDD